jgi:predicted  nucleic acid-binding Zn-ribbon protein
MGAVLSAFVLMSCAATDDGTDAARAACDTLGNAVRSLRDASDAYVSVRDSQRELGVLTDDFDQKTLRLAELERELPTLQDPVAQARAAVRSAESDFYPVSSQAVLVALYQAQGQAWPSGSPLGPARPKVGRVPTQEDVDFFMGLADSYREEVERLQVKFDEAVARQDAVRAERDQLRTDLDAAQQELDSITSRVGLLESADQLSKQAETVAASYSNAGAEAAKAANGSAKWQDLQTAITRLELGWKSFDKRPELSADELAQAQSDEAIVLAECRKALASP